MTVRTIITGEQPVLRTQCQEINEFSESVAQLLTDLADTQRHHRGVGLAAPQIGVSLQAAVVDIGEGVIELINPRVTHTEGSQNCVESCLSFPSTVLQLTRPQKVTVEAQNRQGETFQLEAEGTLSRVLCHEIDHLNGILFFDHLSEEDFFTQMFNQVAGSTEPATANSTGPLTEEEKQQQDMRMATDMMADAAWKLELAAELMQEYPKYAKGSAIKKLRKLTTQLNKLTEELDGK